MGPQQTAASAVRAAARRLAALPRRGAGRVLTVLVLVFATPGLAPILQEAVSLVASSDCCDHQCDGRSDRTCPGTCTDCACCAPLNTVPAPALLLPPSQGPGELALWRGGLLGSPGYRAPPFRPPST